MKLHAGFNLVRGSVTTWIQGAEGMAVVKLSSLYTLGAEMLLSV